MKTRVLGLLSLYSQLIIYSQLITNCKYSA